MVSADLPAVRLTFTSAFRISDHGALTYSFETTHDSTTEHGSCGCQSQSGWSRNAAGASAALSGLR